MTHWPRIDRTHRRYSVMNRGGKPSKGTKKDKRKHGNGGKKPGPKS